MGSSQRGSLTSKREWRLLLLRSSCELDGVLGLRCLARDWREAKRLLEGGGGFLQWDSLRGYRCVRLRLLEIRVLDLKLIQVIRSRAACDTLILVKDECVLHALAQVHRLNVDITIVAHHCLIKISSRAWHVCLLL